MFSWKTIFKIQVFGLNARKSQVKSTVIEDY